jgi:hypothetical protein
MVDFNLIGFDFTTKRDTKTYRTCLIHPGEILIRSAEDRTLLLCPRCGSPQKYQEDEALTDEQIKGKFRKHQTKILTAKKKRRFYDKFGTEITDETLIQDIMQGKTVINYYEQK